MSALSIAEAAAEALANHIRAKHVLLPMPWRDFTRSEQQNYLVQAEVVLKAAALARREGR